MRKNETKFISHENLASPHIPYIQNSAHTLIRNVERLRESPYSAEFTPTENRFIVKLSDALYTGKLTSAREARYMMGRINEGDLHNDNLLRFAKDLDYLSIYEANGIGGLNQRLLYLMVELKKLPEKELFINLVNEFNDLLYRAIYLFPHEIKSVEIGVKPGYQEINQDLEGRNTYTILQELYEESGRAPSPQELVLPLPYFFGTGTHGSDEGRAASQSYESVALEHVLIHDKDTAVVSVNLEESKFDICKTDFTLDEIDSIKFSAKSDFTPLVRIGRRVSLTERNDYLIHYLLFRGFRKLSVEVKTNEQELEVLQRLLGVSLPNSLWNFGFGPFGSKFLTQGFFIEQGKQGEENVLYEVNDTRIREIDPLIETVSLFLKFMRQQRKMSKNMRSFQGANIISRLAAIPPTVKFATTTPFISPGKPLVKLVRDIRQDNT